LKRLDAISELADDLLSSDEICFHENSDRGYPLVFAFCAMLASGYRHDYSFAVHMADPFALQDRWLYAGCRL
jgi:hypothetical protein